MTLLSIVVPCYNEQEVLPETAKCLLILIEHLQAQGKIGGNSHVVFMTPHFAVACATSAKPTERPLSMPTGIPILILLVARSITLPHLVYAFHLWRFALTSYGQR